jgi:uncharacterized protein
MAKIDPDTFIGIEMQSYGAEKQTYLQKLLSGRSGPRTRMAVIGPANLLKTVHKDSQEIQAVLLTSEGVATASAAVTGA